MCDSGDILVKGSCEGRSEEFAVWLDSTQVNDNGKVGWACQARIVKANQELRITAAATCKKSGEARKIKTPLGSGA